MVTHQGVGGISKSQSERRSPVLSGDNRALTGVTERRRDGIADPSKPIFEFLSQPVLQPVGLGGNSPDRLAEPRLPRVFAYWGGVVSRSQLMGQDSRARRRGGSRQDKLGATSQRERRTPGAREWDPRVRTSGRCG